MRRATILPPEVLGQYGAEENCDSSGIKIHGWCFSSTHDKMACEQDQVDLQCVLSRLCGVNERDDDVIVINGDHLHLPPMNFPRDILTIEHEASQTSLLFKSCDSIACWAMQHKNPETLNVQEVPCAKNWTSATLGSDGLPDQMLKQHKWDWTYHSDYNCTVRVRSSEDEYIVRSGSMVSAVSGIVEPSRPDLESDTAPQLHRWVRCEPGGIDLEMLQARDDILFFDELLLYQDDLQDCGESTYEVRIRVMPLCWFVLGRLFVRVDGSKITILETRCFHAFGSDKVFMEITHKQGNESDYILPMQSAPMANVIAPGASALPPPCVGAVRSSMPPIGLSPGAIPGTRFPPVPGHSSLTGPSMRVGMQHLTGEQLRDANHMSRILPTVGTPENYFMYLGGISS